MHYLNSFMFPDDGMEFVFLMTIKRNCYNTFYPFKILSRRGLESLEFEGITLLYGGNGSGKSTALNIIADKMDASRDSVYNKSNFYSDYVGLCSATLGADAPEKCRIITSDDVFDYMLSVRNINEDIHLKREELFEDYLEVKYAHFQMKSIADYEQLKRVNSARRKTQSRFVNSELMDNIRTYSNGESAFQYFTEKIEDNGLYILDEPENSLSPQRQLDLVKYIEDAVRYFGCQFIISTHSPFLLAIKGAKIYDLDTYPVMTKEWTALPNVRTYYDFFKSHEEAF